jgi:two-component system phosphate regulon response regulator PhoB
MAATILVVEDEPAIQELIAINLARAGYEVLRASNVSQAEALAGEVLPDVILLDWMLPGETGLSFARRLRSQERTKDIPIILLTARADEQDKLAGLEGGADDYITKPFSPRELMARIKAVMRRRMPQLTDDVVEIGGLRLDPVSHRIRAGEASISLGPTEFRILHFFMTHPERVYSRARLLDEIWGDHVYVEERTVDVHIRRLRSALEAFGHDRLIETIRGSGYCFRSGHG